MKITRFILFVFVASVFWSGCGCEMFKNHTDPMANPKAGWKHADLSKVYKGTEPDAAISKDVDDYIHSFPPYSCLTDTQDFLYEDGTGRHAVKIRVPSNGTEWTHVLIYDQNDKRIQIIKYISGHYGC